MNSKIDKKLNIAGKLSRKYAVKSGTTDTDSLTVGYNKDLMMMIWMGYDDNQKTPTKLSGSVKNIWADTVETILKGSEGGWYETPDNIVGVPLNAITGEKTSDQNQETMFYYVKGTEPGASSYVSTNN